MDPVSPSSDHRVDTGLPQTGGTRTQPSRSCKSRDQSPAASLPSTKVAMDKKQMHRLTASVHYGNAFCALAFLTFAAMINQGDPEWILPASYIPPEPSTHRQAMNSQEREEWLEAERKELQSLRDNHVFTECKLPPGRRTVRTKWIYKVKRDKNGNISKYKARLVAQGFTQIEGLDFNETYSPVARFTSIRTLLALSAILGYHVHQMDVETAFLNGELKEEIYVVPPEGWPVQEGNVLRVNKALYGLKQSSRQWNENLNTFLLS